MKETVTFAIAASLKGQTPQIFYRKYPNSPPHFPTHNIFKTHQVENLKGFYKLLQYYHQKSNVCHVYGIPRKGIQPPCPRDKSTLQPALGYRFLHVDVDGYNTTRVCDFRKISEVEFAARECIEKNFPFLKDVSIIVLLSGSQKPQGDKLKAHIYFESKEPVQLYEVKKAAEQAKAQGVLIDPSVYQVHQPDFILPPPAKLDKLPQRLFFFDDLAGVSPDFHTWVAVHATAKDIAGISQEPLIHKSWKEIVKLCGTDEHGINAPAWQAAIRMVEENPGRLEGIYASELWAEAWKWIEENHKKGLADSRNIYSDRKKYTPAKFESYIKYAVQRYNKNKAVFERAVKKLEELKKAVDPDDKKVLQDEAKDIVKQLPATWRERLEAYAKKHKLKTITDKVLKAAQKLDIKGITRFLNDNGWYVLKTDKYRMFLCKNDLRIKIKPDYEDSTLSSALTQELNVPGARNSKQVRANLVAFLTSPYAKNYIKIYECYEAAGGIVLNGKLYFRKDKEDCYVIDKGIGIEPSPREILWVQPEEFDPIEVGKTALAIHKAFNPVDHTRIMTWIMGCFYPEAFKPILYLKGGAGAGKTTFLRFLHESLTGSCNYTQGSLDSQTASRANFLSMASKLKIIAFDNLVKRIKSDEDVQSLCRAIDPKSDFVYRGLYKKQEDKIKANLSLIFTSTRQLFNSYELIMRTSFIDINLLKSPIRFDKPENIKAFRRYIIDFYKKMPKQETFGRGKLFETVAEIVAKERRVNKDKIISDEQTTKLKVLLQCEPKIAMALHYIQERVPRTTTMKKEDFYEEVCKYALELAYGMPNFNGWLSANKTTIHFTFPRRTRMDDLIDELEERQNLINPVMPFALDFIDPYIKITVGKITQNKKTQVVKLSDAVEKELQKIL